MTKTILDNDMVAHVWAQQKQPHGRSHNGNFSFDGAALSSYSTVIARFVTDDKVRLNGQRVVMCDSHGYSKTTSGKHQNPMRRALHGLPLAVFTVPAIPRHSPTIGAADHARNVAYLTDCYEKQKASFKRQRDVWQDIGETLRELAQTLADYRKAFKLRGKPLAPDVDAAAVLAYRAERDARANAPGMAEKREAERLRRIERKEAKEHAARVARAEKEKETRESWLAGNSVYFRGTDIEGGALLRVAGDTLETSQGAEVPLAHAIKAFRFIKLVKERGEAWHRNGHTMRVGHFQVDAIDADGSIRAGCHRIFWPEIERVARLLNVWGDVASDAALEPSQAAT